MKNLRVIFGTISTAITLSFLKASTSAYANSVRSGMQAAHGSDQPTSLFGDGAIFTTIVDTMLFLIGAIAVIMIIFGGFRYVVSGGNATSVTAAKNTILYAIIGIVVALLSWAALDFILTSLEGGTGTSGL